MAWVFPVFFCINDALLFLLKKSVVAVIGVVMFSESARVMSRVAAMDCATSNLRDLNYVFKLTKPTLSSARKS